MKISVKSHNFIYCDLSWFCVFQMLLNLHKKSWIDGLVLQDYKEHTTSNEETVKTMLELAKNYNKVSTLY